MSGALVALGVLGWSFSEYALHHWVGHLTRGRTAFSRQHLTHHARRGYFTPIRVKLATALPVSAALSALAVALLGATDGTALMAGFLGTYVSYELFHWSIHIYPPRNRVGRWLRRHHLSHHFTNPKHNHGVTSPFWDLLFQTYRPAGRVRVPARHALDWMLDPATGELLAEHRDDYVITGGASRGERQGARDADAAAAFSNQAPAAE